MLTPRLDPDRVYDVAEQLPLDRAAIDDSVWTECLDARNRSAISRAYYAVFLSLKRRLVESGELQRPFPDTGVHARLARAVRNGLRPYHRLNQKLTNLCADREDADYTLDWDIDPERAETRLDDAHAALEMVDALTANDIERIAKQLDGR